MDERKIKLKLNPVEAGLLDRLMALGWSETEVLRIALRLFAEKELHMHKSPGRPPKVREEKREEPIKSPEELCEEEGGEVVEKEGIKQCLIKRGALEHYKPL